MIKFSKGKKPRIIHICWWKVFIPLPLRDCLTLLCCGQAFLRDYGTHRKQQTCEPLHILSSFGFSQIASSESWKEPQDGGPFCPLSVKTKNIAYPSFRRIKSRFRAEKKPLTAEASNSSSFLWSVLQSAPVYRSSLARKESSKSSHQAWRPQPLRSCWPFIPLIEEGSAGGLVGFITILSRALNCPRINTVTGKKYVWAPNWKSPAAKGRCLSQLR